MACSGRYAEAWQFASFWCIGTLLSRLHDGANNAGVLTDSQIDFEEQGIEANKGMVVYNVTDGSSGVVAAVSGHTLTATLTGGTDNDWDTNDRYRIVTIDSHEIATIELYLDIAASDIHSALAASGACDCTLASWATMYLQKLNIIDATTYYQCPCAKPNISDDQRQAYLEWMNAQLELIRQSKIELCSGATGAEFPAVGFAEMSLTEFAAARLVYNDRDD